MIWDACLARAVAAELEERIGGARATAISLLREERAVHLYLREATLRVELKPGLGVLAIDPPADRPDDAEALPATLTRVRAVPDERVIVLHFRRVRGRKPHPALILELATNRWNALWAEEPELRIRRRLLSVGHSPPQIGQPWPEPPERESRAMPERSEWDALVGEGDREARRRRLLGRVAYLSALNVEYLLTANDADEAFQRWRRLAEGVAMRPHLLRRRSGMQPYPWGLGEEGAVATGNLLEAMETLRAARPTQNDARASRVGRILTQRARRLKRMIGRLGRELEKTAEGPRLRADASLILASLSRIEAGSRRVALTDFDGTTRTLELDPQLRPQDHAGVLFRRASRMERGQRELPQRIRAAREALAQVESLRRRHAEGRLDRAEVDEVLAQSDSIPSRGPGEGAGRRGPALPYRSFRSSGGIEIRVGRGKRHNDALTFHHSRPGDIWLHARHAAGAHVILRWRHPERPPATDLGEAAALAALHSKARGSAHVAVDWTRRKWVRKPRGAAPGAVVPDRVQTVFVAPAMPKGIVQPIEP